MLERKEWPNGLGFDLMDGDREVAEFMRLPGIGPEDGHLMCSTLDSDRESVLLFRAARSVNLMGKLVRLNPEGMTNSELLALVREKGTVLDESW
jgi:hypothetical protein